VGAGVIGAAMASLLVARKLSTPGRVAIVADRFAGAAGTDATLGGAPAADLDWDLRVFALSRASERLLDICGVWDSLPRNRGCLPMSECAFGTRAAHPGARARSPSIAPRSANPIWGSSSKVGLCNLNACKPRAAWA
jgi:2-polyprenyl-6-methoxyphenol hydroxylase-like FAD-dependent oxidoreductase